jgi:predicted nucleic-acid-binding Zn-ribbon protein
MHSQESTSCKKCGQFLHPLWFDSKGIKCMEKEYEKKKVALGLDVEVKI